MPILPEITTGALGDDPNEKIDSVVKQLNDWGNIISQEATTLKRESNILMNYWFGSYKLTSGWATLPGSITTIDFDEWQPHAWYWETTIFTDAGTGYVRLYNVTDGEAVSGTEFSTTSTGEDNAEYYRSSQLTKPRGTKTFRVQVRIDGGNGTSQYVNCMKSSMIFKIEGA